MTLSKESFPVVAVACFVIGAAITILVAFGLTVPVVVLFAAFAIGYVIADSLRQGA